jgi:hypothetical protein
MSTYVTLVKESWNRGRHHGPWSQAGFCTVSGYGDRRRHRAQWSIEVQSPKDRCWLAACDEHVPPLAD